MANEQNLKPVKTKKEARERGKAGGKASGEARRRKRTMKQTLEMIATLPFNIKDKNGNSLKEQLEALGINTNDIDYEMAMNYSMFLTSISGGKNSVGAATFIRDTLGEKPKEQIEVSKFTDETVKEVDDYLCQKKKN